MQEGAALLTDPDDGDRVSEILVNGCLGHIYVPDDPENFTVITWIDEPKNAFFSIHAFQTRGFLIGLCQLLKMRRFQYTGSAKRRFGLKIGTELPQMLLRYPIITNW